MHLRIIKIWQNSSALKTCLSILSQFLFKSSFKVSLVRGKKKGPELFQGFVTSKALLPRELSNDPGG